MKAELGANVRVRRQTIVVRRAGVERTGVVVDAQLRRIGLRDMHAIGRLGRLTNIKVPTIRFYEEVG